MSGIVEMRNYTLSVNFETSVTVPYTIRSSLCFIFVKTLSKTKDKNSK